jgi:hypothetical protein
MLTSMARTSLAIAVVALAATGAGQVAVAAPAPSAPLHHDTYLIAVSADSATDAWAVGDKQESGVRAVSLVEHWDGTSWSLMPTSHAVAVANLTAVEAISPTDVWVVGSTPPPPEGEGSPVTIAAHWDGTRWTHTPTPGGGGDAVDSYLYAVSASGTDDVWAAGWFTPSGGDARSIPLCLHWGADHQWTDMRCPTGGKGSGFTTVTTPSPDNAVFGGAAWRKGHDEGFIEQYTGGAWTRQPRTHVVVVDQLSAVSTTDIWGIGTIGDFDDPQVIHSDGTSWKPVTGPFGSGLESIDMDAANDGWIVSDDFIYHWDGSAWSRARTSQHAMLWSVSAVDAQDAWTVGETGDEHLRARAYTLHWDGTTWTKIYVPV